MQVVPRWGGEARPAGLEVWLLLVYVAPERVLYVDGLYKLHDYPLAAFERTLSVASAFMAS